jgi:small subunit ribosomal protein S15
MASLEVAEKAQIVEQFKTKPGDTGSPQVQVALLTAKIKSLTEHFKANKHDYHSRYGLQRMINLRRKLLDYLKRTNYSAYATLIEALGLRR